jgi:predicted transcriptional regulator
MENIEKIIAEIADEIIKPESKVNSIAVIENENRIVYSTENWDISDDIKDLNSTWDKLESKRITISGIEYIILQITPERLIARNLEKAGSIVGFRDEERKVICKVDDEGSPQLGLLEASIELRERSSKKPYMDPKASLGKVEQLKWATPRILLDDTNNLQELGLLKFGLSIEEAKVYLALLEKGKKGDKVGNLNEDLDIKRTTIYRILDRLIDKGWVVRLPGMSKGAQIYIARPLHNILDERIQQKEEELKILKSFRFIMGEGLENGWINMSEVPKDLKPFKKGEFSFKTLGITGVEKDCGLLIFEYGSDIGNEIIIRAALQLACEKLKLGLQIDDDIEEYENPDLEDIKFDFTKIREYLGAFMYLKFKEGTKTANNVGTDWIIATKQVAIPIKEKIYVIWGSEEKFPILLDIILKLK